MGEMGTNLMDKCMVVLESFPVAVIKCSGKKQLRGERLYSGSQIKAQSLMVGKSR